MVLVGFWVMLAIHSLVSLRLLLHAWDAPGGAADARVWAATRDTPSTSFSLIVPARDEATVISGTLASLAELDYPRSRWEVVVVCHRSDRDTIRAAKHSMAHGDWEADVRLLIYDAPHQSKPAALNEALAVCEGDYVGIIDAEDDVRPGLLRVVDALIAQAGATVVQGGVQLMNVHGPWFATLNCLEYYAWFGSRLHHDASLGAMPLGGNTVFFSRDVLEEVGGWEPTALTEDADIGIALSLRGESFRVFYEPSVTTREEAPVTIGEFVRQRTRWHQGFLQILFKGQWRRFRRREQRLLVGYTLTYPFVAAVTATLWPIALAALFVVRLPPVLVLVSLMPLLVLFLHGASQLVLYRELVETYGIAPRIKGYANIVLGVIPYSLLLGFSSYRAMYRMVTGRLGWEKTTHLGAHRGGSGHEAVVV